MVKGLVFAIVGSYSRVLVQCVGIGVLGTSLVVSGVVEGVRRLSEVGRVGAMSQHTAACVVADSTHVGSNVLEATCVNSAFV